jgi:Hemerythrin HHE cation binding domain
MAAGQQLAGLLGAHTRAEEEICYPMSGCSRLDAGRRRDAIDDHEDIREAIGEASLQRVGSALWWRAVRAVLAVSAGHLDREERDVLPCCLAGPTVSQRRELGQQWLRFIAAWTLDAQPELGSGMPGRAASLGSHGRRRGCSRPREPISTAAAGRIFPDSPSGRRRDLRVGKPAHPAVA